MKENTQSGMHSNAYIYILPAFSDCSALSNRLIFICFAGELFKIIHMYQVVVKTKNDVYKHYDKYHNKKIPCSWFFCIHLL